MLMPCWLEARQIFMPELLASLSTAHCAAMIWSPCLPLSPYVDVGCKLCMKSKDIFVWQGLDATS